VLPRDTYRAGCRRSFTTTVQAPRRPPALPTNPRRATTNPHQRAAQVGGRALRRRPPPLLLASARMLVGGEHPHLHFAAPGRDPHGGGGHRPRRSPGPCRWRSPPGKPTTGHGAPPEGRSVRRWRKPWLYLGPAPPNPNAAYVRLRRRESASPRRRLPDAAPKHSPQRPHQA